MTPSVASVAGEYERLGSKLAKFRKNTAAILATKAKTRRAQEAITAAHDRLGRLAGTNSVHQNWRHARHRLEALATGLPISAETSRYRAHVERLATAHKVAISYTAGVQNSYAFVEAKRVESSPIFGLESYISLLHEVGHCVSPCRRRGTPGHTSPCCSCELRAWGWTLVTALNWTTSAHLTLALSIATYRPLATAHERRTIDEWTSEHGYRVTRLLRATHGLRSQRHAS